MFNTKLVNALINGVNVTRKGRDRSWEGVLATGKFRIAHDNAIMIQVDDSGTKKEINFSTLKAGFMVYARDSVPYGQETKGKLACSFWFDGIQAVEAELPYNKIQSGLKRINKDPMAGISRLFNSDMIAVL